MVDITATAWTETVEERTIEGKKKRNRVRLDLSATQTQAYPPTGGMPLPTTLGMVRNVDYVILLQGGSSATNGIMWNYEVTAHAIKGYWALNPTAVGGATHLQELPTTWNVSETNVNGLTFYVEAVGW